MRAIRIDLASRVPVYEQIAGELRAVLARGELAVGEALPSVRELGAAVGVNLNTVARAYRILAEEGLIELRHGASARVKAPTARKVAGVIAEEEERRLDDLISRWLVRGADRRAVERAFAAALTRWFEGG